MIFDDVVVPWDRVFLDGDTTGHDEIITHTNWRAHIVNQAMIRAWTKLELTFGVAHLIADATGVNSFDHVQEKLGEIWSVRRDDARRRDRLARPARSRRSRARTGRPTSGRSSRCAG